MDEITRETPKKLWLIVFPWRPGKFGSRVRFF